MPLECDRCGEPTFDGQACECCHEGTLERLPALLGIDVLQRGSAAQATPALRQVCGSAVPVVSAVADQDYCATCQCAVFAFWLHCERCQRALCPDCHFDAEMLTEAVVLCADCEEHAEAVPVRIVSGGKPIGYRGRCSCGWHGTLRAYSSDGYVKAHGDCERHLVKTARQHRRATA